MQEACAEIEPLMVCQKSWERLANCLNKRKAEIIFRFFFDPARTRAVPHLYVLLPEIEMGVLERGTGWRASYFVSHGR